MPQPPTVSIGMPVYNGARFLPESLETILRQTYTDFELIISDNASTDNTEEICRRFASLDTRVHYHRMETNLGAAANYRQVFELARGHYFRWAPADDLFAPDSVECCVRTLDDHPEAVLCYPKTVLINENGGVIRPYDDDLHLPFPDAVERFRRAKKQIGLVNVLYGLIRASTLRQTSLMGHYSGADMVFVLELSLYGQFIEIPHPLFFRRIHPAAMSSKKSVEGDQEFFDPKTKGRLFMRSWRHHFEEGTAILRSPLKWKDKGRLMYVVGRSGIISRQELLKELIWVIRQGLRRSSLYK